MTSLSRDKIERFWRDGVLTVEDAVSPKGTSFFLQQGRDSEEAAR